MTKSCAATISLLMAASSLFCAHAQVDGYSARVSPVQVNRELPRTETISYKTQAEALTGGRDASIYLQPLDGAWESAAGANGARTFSRSYKVPFDWADRQYFLRLASVNGPYSVTVNGHQAGYNQSGRTAAEFDLTPFSKEGLNHLEITVYGNAASKVLEDYPHDAAPAITGEAFIVSQPRIRVRDYRVGLEGPYENGSANLTVSVLVKSHFLNEKTYTLYCTVLDPSGNKVIEESRKMTVEMRGEDSLYFHTLITEPRLWSPDSPDIHTVLFRMQVDGRNTEFVAYRTGLREISMDGIPGGQPEDGALYLNRKKVDRLTAAEYNVRSSADETEKDLRRMRDSGVNMVWVANHARPDWFYSLCDRVGIFVCNSTDIDTRNGGSARTKGGNPSNDPQWAAAYTDRALTMYHTSKNHPSVLMFSLAGAGSSNGYNLYESYLALKRVDNRPVVYLGAGGEWNTDALTPQAASSGNFPYPRITVEMVPGTGR